VRGRLFSNPWGLTAKQLATLRAVASHPARCDACSARIDVQARAASDLAVSVKSIEAHLAGCRSRMGASTTAAAVRILRDHEAKNGPLAADG
jgi:hypothetical protein